MRLQVAGGLPTTPTAATEMISTRLEKSPITVMMVKLPTIKKIKAVMAMVPTLVVILSTTAKMV